MRKCIITTTATNKPIILNHLPSDVTFDAERDSFEVEGAIDIKLYGKGLPPWCACQEGAVIIRAVAELCEDGTMRLIPGTGTPLRQIPDNIKE